MPSPEYREIYERAHMETPYGIDLHPWMKYFDPTPGASILDLGCGSGPNLIYYGQRGHKVDGVEIAQSAVDVFDRDKPAGLNARIHHCAIEDFEPLQKFDYVLLTEVLEHVEDPQKVMDVAAKCLTDGGTVYITAPSVRDDNPRHLRTVSIEDIETWMTGKFQTTEIRRTGNRVYVMARRLQKAPIVVCDPRIKLDARHIEHFESWFADNKQQHNLVRCNGYWRALHKAQMAAVETAFRIGASHVLFTESDHWGYADGWLEELLNADKDVIGYHTYAKNYPFNSLCMHRAKPGMSMLSATQEMLDRGEWLKPFDLGRNMPLIQKTDLITWAFTLVKLSVFDRMRAAWGNMLISQSDLRALIDGDAEVRERFRLNVEKPLGLQPFRQWGPVPTDSFFCQYCEDLGIDRFVHFGQTVGHGDVGPEDLKIAKKLRDMRHSEEGTEPVVEMEDNWGNVYGTANMVAVQGQVPEGREAEALQPKVFAGAFGRVGGGRSSRAAEGDGGHNGAGRGALHLRPGAQVVSGADAGSTDRLPTERNAVAGSFRVPARREPGRGTEGDETAVYDGETGMNILIATIDLTEIGGTQTWVETMARELGKRHTVEIFSPRDGKFRADRLADFSPPTRKEYNLCLINHSSKLSNGSPRGFRVFTSHGPAHNLEMLVPGADAYACVSEEIQRMYPHFSPVVMRQPLDLERFRPEGEGQGILILTKNAEAKDLCREACEIAGLKYDFAHYQDRPVYEVEEMINRASAVISSGRGIVEAMACNRPAFVLARRRTSTDWEVHADGWVTPQNAEEIMRVNYSGRSTRTPVTAVELAEMLKAQPPAWGREWAEVHHNVKDVAARYVSLAAGVLA